MGITAWIRSLRGSRRGAKRELSTRRRREELFPNLFVRQLEERRVLNGTPLNWTDDPHDVTVDAGANADDGAADTFHVVRDEDTIRVSVNGDEVYSALLGDVDSLTLNGSGDDDTVILDLSGGDPFPAGGIFCDGMGGDDLLRIEGAPVGGGVDTVVHRFDRIGEGSVGVHFEAPGLAGVIDYTGVESITNATVADDLVFEFAGTSETVTLSDDGDPDDDESLITSTEGTPVTFATPRESLLVVTDVGSMDDDTVNVEGLDSRSDADLSIRGGDDDAVDFTGAVDLNGGNLTVNSGVIGVHDALATEGGNVNLESTTSTTVAGPIDAGAGDMALTADRIELTSGGLQGTGGLLLQPLGAGTSIGLAGGAGVFNLDATELALVQDGFSGIMIGRSDGAHTITVDAFSFADPVTIRTPFGGSITVDGQLDTLAVGGPAAIELMGPGATTTLNADIITAGAPVTINDSVLVSGARTIRTTGALDDVNGGAVHITGPIDGANVGGTDTLWIDAAKGGVDGDGDAAVTLDSAVEGGAGAQSIPGGEDLEGLTIDGGEIDLAGVHIVGSIAVSGTDIGLGGVYYQADEGGGSETITFTGPVKLGANVAVTGSGGAGDTVEFAGTIDSDGGPWTLDVQCGAAEAILGGVIGGSAPLAHLFVNAATGSGAITVAGIGGLSEGVVGATVLGCPVTGSIEFSGTVYHANEQYYTAVSGLHFNLTAGAATSFTSSDDAINFFGAGIQLSDGSHLSVTSNGGEINARGGIAGTSDETVVLNADGGSTNTVWVKDIGAGDEILSVTLTGSGGVYLGGDVITSSTSAGNHVTVSGTAMISGNPMVSTAAGGGDITFDDIVGPFVLPFVSDIVLDAGGGLVAVGQIGLAGGGNGINEVSIIGTGGVTLNGDVFTTKDISFGDAGNVWIEGPVVLGADVVVDTTGSGGAAGSVYFNGTIDSDAIAGRALCVVAFNQWITFNGDIGSVGRLGDLDVDCAGLGGRVVLEGDIFTQGGHVDFSGVVVGPVVVTGNDDGDFVVDTEDGTGDSAAGTIDFSDVTLWAQGVALVFDARDGGGAVDADGDVFLFLPGTGVLGSGSVDIDANRITTKSIVTAGGAIDLNATATAGDVITLNGAGFNTSWGGAVAAGSLRLTSGGGRMVANSPSGLTLFYTDGIGTSDGSITIDVAVDAASGQQLRILAGTGPGADVDLNGALGAGGQFGPITVEADEVHFDADVESTGIEVTAQSSIEFGSGDGTGTTSPTIDANGFDIVLRSLSFDAGASATITSTDATVERIFLLPLAGSQSIGLGDGAAAADVDVSESMLRAVDASLAEIIVGLEGTSQTGSISIDDSGGLTGINTTLRLRAGGAGAGVNLASDLAIAGAGSDLIIDGSGATTHVLADLTLQTNGGDIAIHDSLSLADGVTLTLDTQAGGGDVSVDGNIRGDGGGNEHLTVTAGSGSVTLGDATSDEIGTQGGDRFGNVGVTTTGSVTINAQVQASTLTVAGPAAGATFNETINLDAGAAGDVFDVTATDVIFAAAADLTTAGGGSVTIKGTGVGAVTLPDTPAAGHELDGSFTIDDQFGGGVGLGEDIRTSGDAITIDSPVTLSADVSLDTTHTVPAGAAITLDLVDGGAGTFALTLNGGSSGNVTTGNLGLVSPLGGLTIAGAQIDLKDVAVMGGDVAVTGANIDLNGTSYHTTVSGAITFTGPVDLDAPSAVSITTAGGADDDVTFQGTLILGRDLTVTAGSGDVTFQGAVNDDGGGGTSSDLVIDSSGTTRFNASVGGGNPIESVTTDAPGTTEVNAAITTSGGTQTYSDPLVLTGDVTLTDHGSSGIFFNNTVNGDGSGPWDLTVVTTNGASDVQFNNAVGNVNALDAVTITNAGTLTIAAAGDMNLAGPFLQNGAGSINTAGDVDTSDDDVTFTAAVTLAGDVDIDTTGTAAGNILFSSTIDMGGNNLALDAGPAGNVTLSGAVSGGGDLTIRDGAVQSYQGLTVNALSIEDATASVTFGAAVSTTSTIEVTSEGTITVDGTMSSGGSNITLNATSGLIRILDPVMSTPGIGGTITITGAVDIDAMIAAGAGDIEINGNISGASDLDIDAEITASGTISFSAPRDILIGAKLQTTASGADIILTADSDTNGVGGVRIETAGLLDSEDDVVLTGSDLFVTGGSVDSVRVDADGIANQIVAEGDVTLQRQTAGVPVGADVVIDGRIETTVDGGIAVNAEDDASGVILLSANLTAAAEIDFQDAVQLTGGVTLTADDIDFDSTLDGPFDLVLADSGVTTVAGAVGGATPLGDGTGASLTINSSGTTVFESTVAAASGIRQADAAGRVTFRDDVTVGVGDTGSEFLGDVTLDGMEFTSNDGLAVRFGNEAGSDELTLSSGDVVIDINPGAQGTADLTVEALLYGGQDLLLQVDGSTRFAGELGSSTPLGDATGAAIRIESLGTTVFESTVRAASGIQQADTAGRVTFRGDVTVGIGDTSSEFLGHVTLDGMEFTSNDGLALSFGNAAGSDELRLSSGDVMIDINAGAQGTAALTVTALVDGSQDLVLQVDGSTQFAGVVGGATPVGDQNGAAIRIESLGATVFEETVGAESGIQQADTAGRVTFRDDVTVGVGDTGSEFLGHVTMDGMEFTSNDGLAARFGNEAGSDELTLSSGDVVIDINAGVQGTAGLAVTALVDGGQDLLLQVDGATQFAGAVGGTTPVGDGSGAAITVESLGTTVFESTVAAASGIQQADTAGRVTFWDDATVGVGDTGSEFLGHVTLDGMEFTSNDGLALRFGNAAGSDELTLSSGDVVIDINAGAQGAAALTVTALVDGGRDLLLQVDGSTQFAGAVGGTTPVGDGSGAAITVESLGTTVFETTVVAASGIRQADTAARVTFWDDVTIGAGDTSSEFLADVTLDGMTLSSDGAVTLGNTAGDEVRLSSSAVWVRTTGAGDTVTVNATIDGDQDLTLDSGEDVLVNAGIGTGGGALSILADDDVVLDASVELASGGGAVTVRADDNGDADGSGGALIMEGGSSIVAGSGTVTLSADEAVTLANVQTTTTLSATSVHGAITDTPDANIAVGDLATFNGLVGITLGDRPGDTTNFGSLAVAGGVVRIQEDSDTVLVGADVETLALDAAGDITTQDGVVRAQGLITLDTPKNILVHDIPALPPGASEIVGGEIVFTAGEVITIQDGTVLESATGKVSNAPPLLRIGEVDPDDVVVPGDRTQDLTGTVGGIVAEGDNLEQGANFTITVRWDDGVTNVLTGVDAGDTVRWIIRGDGTGEAVVTPGDPTGPIEVLIIRDYPVSYLITVAETELIANVQIDNDPAIRLFDGTGVDLNRVDAIVKTDFAGEKFHWPPAIVEQERPRALIVEETPVVFEPRTTAIVQVTRFEETRRSQEEVGESERELYIVKVGQDGIERDREPLPDTALSNLKALFDVFRRKGLPNGLYRIYLEEPGFPRRKVIEFYKSGTSFGDPVQEPGRGSLPVGEPPSQAPEAESGEEGPMVERVDRFWSRWAALPGTASAPAAGRDASTAVAKENDDRAAAPALVEARGDRAPDDDLACSANWPNRLKLPLGIAAALASMSLARRGTEKDWERRIDAAMEGCEAESFTRAARLRRRFR